MISTTTKRTLNRSITPKPDILMTNRALYLILFDNPLFSQIVSTLIAEIGLIFVRLHQSFSTLRTKVKISLVQFYSLRNSIINVRKKIFRPIFNDRFTLFEAPKFVILLFSFLNS